MSFRNGTTNAVYSSIKTMYFAAENVLLKAFTTTECSTFTATPTNSTTMMQVFDENSFRRRVDKALTTVRQILQNTRRPVYAADAHHCYSDKFVLANLLVRLALSSMVQGLSVLGIPDNDLGTMMEWSKTNTVSLRLIAHEKCKFVKETVREQESATRTETTGHFGSMSFGSSSKTVTKVTEYVWAFEGKYEIVAFKGVGADPADRIVIKSRDYSREILTGSKSNPRYEHQIYPNMDVNISWLLQHINADRSVKFEIDREAESTRTPRRNKDVDEALQHLTQLSQWSLSVRRWFVDQLFAVASLGLSDKERKIDVQGANADGVFVPVAPLFIEEAAAGGEPGQLNLKPTDVAAFLAEQKRSLGEKALAAASTFPAEGVMCGADAQLLVCLSHLAEVAVGLSEGVGYVEHMLRQQLYAAVGKEITSADFAAFRRFHNRKLFRDDVQPLPFSFAVRRSPLHSPEGVLAIEGSSGGMAEPVVTHVRAGKAQAPMKFSISAATNVQFRGDRFLHAWLMHSFSGEGEPEVALTAQARQLSSFVVLIGRIASADTFEPKHAMIVQNKDDFRVPLKLATLPTAKEFKDAIESLSPEQQEFCRAWRAMQLESTLFAVCVVQIKPLLERVLNLPKESLAKEIKLTQDLTELFIKYQIPADLLTAGTIEPPASADGFEVVGGSAADKVAEVKGHVAAMYELIDGEKKKQLTDAAQTAAFGALDSGLLLTQVADDDLSVMECTMAAPPMPPPQRFGGGRVGAGMRRARGGPPPPPPSAPAPAPMAVPAPPAANAVGAPPQQAAAAAPTRQQPQQEGGEFGAGASEGVDYTKLPAQLDRRLEALDRSNAVRPTIISARETWRKKITKSLMAKAAEEVSLGEEELREERKGAFELLDALTRSGALVVEDASLHVVVGATHTFDKGLVDTVVQDNVNPVVQVERSSLIMASSVLGVPAAELVRPEHLARVQANTPALFAPAMAPALQGGAES